MVIRGGCKGGRTPPRHGRGATLVELCVVFFLFLLMISLILGFYTSAIRVSNQRDHESQSFRHATEVLDKIETLLENARIYSVETDKIVFTALDPSLPIDNGATRWDSQASMLMLYHGQLVYTRGEEVRLLVPLSGDKLKFQQVQERFIEVELVGPPRGATRGTHVPEPDYQLTRRFLVEVY